MCVGGVGVGGEGGNPMIDYLINVGCNGPSQFMIQRPKQRTDPGDPHGLQSDLDSIEQD